MSPDVEIWNLKSWRFGNLMILAKMGCRFQAQKAGDLGIGGPPKPIPYLLKVLKFVVSCLAACCL